MPEIQIGLNAHFGWERHSQNNVVSSVGYEVKRHPMKGLAGSEGIVLTKETSGHVVVKPTPVEPVGECDSELPSSAHGISRQDEGGWSKGIHRARWGWFLLFVVWIGIVTTTWFVSHDRVVTLMALVCVPFSPFFVMVGSVALLSIGVVAWMILSSLYFCLGGIFLDMFPSCKKRNVLFALILLWLLFPLYTYVTKRDLMLALELLVMVPILIYSLIFFLGVFISWFSSASKVRSPIGRVFAYIGVAIAIAVMMYVGMSSNNRNDYYEDQWDRGDSTYYRLR